jgi:hypothetical protein
MKTVTAMGTLRVFSVSRHGLRKRNKSTAEASLDCFVARAPRNDEL